jgi:hypothetical protein
LTEIKLRETVAKLRKQLKQGENKNDFTDRSGLSTDKMLEEIDLLNKKLLETD